MQPFFNLVAFFLFLFCFYNKLDPLPANNLSMRAINETSIELRWSNQLVNNVFDELHILCLLNDPYMSKLNNVALNRTIPYLTLLNDKVNSFIMSNLISGLRYNCTIETIINGNANFSARIRSETAYKMTSK
jgi:hypothetical protein